MPICWKGKLHPSVPATNQLLTVNHILGDGKRYEKIHKKSFQAANLTLLFKDVPAPQIIEYLKKLLPAPIEQAINAQNYCICFQIIHIIYMYKLCLALNDPQRLICHKTKTPQLTKLTWRVLFSFALSTSLIVLNASHPYLNGVMVIVVGNEHGDTSSNPGRDRLHFT